MRRYYDEFFRSCTLDDDTLRRASANKGPYSHSPGRSGGRGGPLLGHGTSHDLLQLFRRDSQVSPAGHTLFHNGRGHHGESGHSGADHRPDEEDGRQHDRRPCDSHRRGRHILGGGQRIRPCNSGGSWAYPHPWNGKRGLRQTFRRCDGFGGVGACHSHTAKHRLYSLRRRRQRLHTGALRSWLHPRSRRGAVHDGSGISGVP